MKKINVYLSNVQYHRLKCIQEDLDTSMAEVVRRAIDSWLVQYQPPSLGMIKHMTLEELSVVVACLGHRFDEMAARGEDPPYGTQFQLAPPPASAKD